LLDLAMQLLAVLGLFMGIPWLYSHHGPWGDWWVFFLAMSVFTIPFLIVLWWATRRLRVIRKRLRES
jgi:uncharacterized membrane protein AbrB (regulator of aidB expression)